MKREKECKIYSKNNAKCSAKIMQNAVENEWKVYSNGKYSSKIMLNVVQIWGKM